MIIRFEGRTICLSRERFISRLSLVTLCNDRICIGMCETFFFSARRLSSNIIMRLITTRTLVVSAFMMQLISIVVDECVVTSNNAI